MADYSDWGLWRGRAVIEKAVILHGGQLKGDGDNQEPIVNDKPPPNKWHGARISDQRESMTGRRRKRSFKVSWNGIPNG